MMFDAAAPATAAATLGQDALQADAKHADDIYWQDAERPAHHVFGNVEGRAPGRDWTDLTAPELSPQAVADRSHAIIFIDTSVENYQELADAWADRGLVVLIDADRDGIDQMREALLGLQDLDAIHIVSHGEAGALELGTTRIDAAAINGDLLASFASIGGKLSADGDILIYGCDFGAGEPGEEAMAALARATGADVSASSDDTGAAAKGGDWQLEVSRGTIEAGVLKGEQWDGLLARTNTGAWTVDGTGQVATTTVDGVTVTITFSGGGSSTFSGTSNQTFNNIAAFDNNAQGQPSLGTSWTTNNTTDVGTITISFSQAVVNPVINLDRLGGATTANNVTTSNSALLTLLTSGATLTKIAGPSHFVVDSGAGTITRTPGVTVAANGESSLTPASGTAAGSVRVNGTFTTLQFSIRMNPGAAAGSGDGFEIGTAVDASPTARADAFTQGEDFGTFTGNLLNNNGNGADSDPRGDALTVTSARNSAGTVIPIGTATTLPSGATVTIAANGAITYANNGIHNSLAAGQSRVETISYTIADPNGGTSTATATITINGVNDVPVAVNDTLTTNEDTSATVNVLANDSDPDRNPLTVTSATAANGSVTIGANGVLTYTPNANFAGADTITYSISDGAGGTATASVAVTVNAVDDPPVNTVPGSQTIAEDGVLVFSTANGNAISIADVDSGTQTVTLNATNGVLTLGSLAGLTFTQGDGTADEVMTFTGTVAAINTALQGARFVPTGDYVGPAQIALRTITSPVAANGFTNGGFELANYPDTNTSRQVDEGAIPGWDTDAADNLIEVIDSGFNGVPAFDGDQFVEVNANQVAPLYQVFQPVAGGNLSVQFAHRGRDGVDVVRAIATDLGADGVLGTADDTVLLNEIFSDGNAAWGVYTRQLAAAATGNLVRLEFRPVSTASASPASGNFIDAVSVVQGAADIDTIAINVTPVVDIAPDSVTTNEDTPVLISPLANDSFEGATSVISAINGAAIVAGGAPVSVANGTVSLNGSGQLTFTPAANYNGTTSFTYTVSSGGSTETATVTVTVAPVNDAPVAVGTLPARASADGSAISVATGAAFTDVDNATLTYSAVGLPAGLTIDATTGIISGTINRSASQTGGGIYNVVVTARDAGGLAATQSFTWTVTNPAPTAANDTASTNEDVPVTITVLANDADPDGDPLTVVSASAANGTVVINANGPLTYTPRLNFNGTDTISYTISDGQGGTASATVTVAVAAVNDAPVAVGTLPARTDADASAVSLATAGAFSDVDNATLSYSATGLPAGLTINAATGVISGTIDRSASQSNGGVYNVVVTARDAGGLTATQAFAWTVTNPAPIAVNDSVTTNEDVPVTIAVLANDSDPDGDPLTVVSATASRGSVVINANGTLTYTPNANINGTDTISYVISDGQGGTRAATVAVTINAVNDAPTAVGSLPGRIGLDAATVSVPTASGFADVDDATLTYSASGLPAGLGIDAATGVITGTIDRSASQVNGGTYNVVVTARDAAGLTATQNFTWLVTNPAPVASNDSLTVNEDVPATIAVLANDSDPDGDPLTVISASAGRGTVTIGAGGVLTYTPNQDYNGPDTIIYVTSDGQGGTATAAAQVTVVSFNDDPVAVNDTASVNEDGAVTIPVLANDSDPDGGTLSIVGASAGNGSVTVSPDGTLTYRPNANYNGTDTITYTISDGQGGTATASVAVTIAPVNDAPVAVGTLPPRSNADGAAVSVATAGGFTDIDSPVLTYSVTGLPAGLGIDAATGIISGTIDRSASQTGSGIYNVVVTARDGSGATASQSFSWQVTNPAPLAANDTASTLEDTPVSIGVLANDTDPDGDPLTVTAASAANGAVTIAANGTLIYMPRLNFNGTDTITYTISDGQGGTSTATVTVTVAAVNDAPVAVNDTATTAEDTPVTIPVLANDSDVDGGVLTVTAASAGRGSVVVNANGTLTYTPAANFNGSDTITYTISDGQGGTATATVAVTVTSVNDAPTSTPLPARSDADGSAVSLNVATSFADVDDDALTFAATGLPAGLSINPATGAITGTIDRSASQLNGGAYTVTITATDAGGLATAQTFAWTITNPAPVAGNDSATTAEDTPVTIAVLANDSDADGDPLTVTTASAGRGTVVVNADGRLTYTPAANFNGTDTISYTISDGQGGTSTASVAVTVTSVNDAPTSTPLPARSDADGSSVNLNVGTSFADVDGDPLTFSAAGLPAGLSINPGTGAITGTIDRSASQSNGGVYSVTVTATDPGGLATTQTFTWTITNPTPVAANDVATTAEDTPVTITVLANDSDPDADPLTVTAASAGRGAVTINADGTLTYTPAANFNGSDTISYTISDGQGGTSTASVAVTVTAVNDAPGSTPLPPRSDTDGSLVAFNVGRSFADVDGDALAFSAIGLPAGLSIDPVTGAITGTIDRSASQADGGVYTVAITATDPSGLATAQSFTWTITNPRPVAANDAATTVEDTPVTISVLANDADPDGDPLTVSAASAGRGSVTINADGTLTYTPAANFNGSDTITYTISDGQGGTSTASVIVTVAAANDAPTLLQPLPPRSDADGEAVNFNLATSFADLDGDTLTFSAVGLPAGLSIDPATGVITGTIDRSASQTGNGAYSVTITATDPGGLTASQTFTWTITNPAPIAANDIAATAEDTPVNIAVLANDSDADGDPLTVTAASAGHGTVTINADGTLTYTPAANFNGTDTISYTIADGQGGTSTASVTVTVSAVNDAPTTTGLPARTDSDAESVTVPVAPAFDDVEGGPLTFSAANLPEGLTIDPATGVISGTIAPTASQVNNGVYAVTVTAADPSGAQASTGFTWTVANVPPFALDDIATTAEDTPVTIAVLANDQDDDVTAVTINGASHGQAVVNADNSITFTPEADFNGTATITYTLTDTQGATSSATVTVTVTPVNDAPTSVALPPRSDRDGEAVNLNLGTSFSDIDSATLVFSATGLPGGLIIDPDTGVVSGTIDRTASQTGGGAYTVTIFATDSGGLTTSQTFTWTITNPAPVAVNDVATTAEDRAVDIAVLTNDADPDGDPLTVTTASAGHGTVTIGAGGTLTYTPDADFNGVDTISYTISDGQGGTSTASVSVTVGAVNDAPVVAATLPARSAADGEAISLPVAGNFSDVDGEALTFSAAGLPAGLVIEPTTGLISGTIERSASQAGGGLYTVTVTATDAAGLTVSQTFTWTITNPVPVASNDIATTAEDVPVNISVLANDSDADGDPLTVIAASAGRGTVAINADGTLTYTPAANFNGADTVSYTISDGQGGTSTASVAVTVTGVNDAPIAAPLPARSDADGEAVSLNLGTGFSDVDGDTLTFSAAGLPAGLTIDPASGTVTGTIDRSASQANDGIYTVTITATDTAGLAASQTFTWAITNPGPVAADDTVTTAEDTPVTISVLTNDSDVDGDPLTVTAASAGRGTVAINPDGTLNYTPAANFNGADTISYTILDGQGGTSTATVVVTVTAANDSPTAVAPLPPRSDADGEAVSFNVASSFADLDGDALTYSAAGLPAGPSIDPTTGAITGTIDRSASQAGGGAYSVTVTATDPGGLAVSQVFSWTVTNPAPVANDDTAGTAEDNAVNIAVLANDTDADGDPLSVTAASAGAGIVTINADGTLTYTPAANFNGSDMISYTISDGQGGTSTATVAVTVASVNDTPVAANDSASTQEDVGLFITVLANDSDVDGDPLTVVAATAANGIVTIGADGRLSFMPSLDFNGTDTITYTISDGRGGTATAVATVLVLPVNDAPVAAADAVTTAEDTAVGISVLANDSDVDGDPLTVTAASAANGSVTINADGTLTYVPAADFNGTDTVSYTISDGRGGTATGTVAVTVMAVNDAPTPASDTASVDEEGTVLIPVLANDSDVDGNTLTVTAASALNGTVVINADGSLSYTPRADFNGTDVVTYTVSDGQGGTATAQVTVTVRPVNDAPFAAPDSVTVNEDQPITVPVLVNDGDVDGDAVSVIAASALNGSVVVNPDGTITYTPAADYNGPDTISYTISDGNGGTASSTVAVTVLAAGDPPSVISPLPSRIDPDGDPLRFDASTAFADPDGESLRFTATGLPPGLSLDPTSGIISGIIAANTSVTGPYVVTVTASDDVDGAASSTFVWTITNPVPVAADDAVTVVEDVATILTPLANDVDPDGDALTIISASAVNGTVTINADGTLTYLGNPDFNGTDTISYVISDGQGGASTAAIAVTVTPANDAPTAASLPARSDNDGAAVLLPVGNLFADLDGDALRFTATGLPAGLAIDPVTGNISGTISNAASDLNGGFYSVTVTATDAAGASVSTSFGWVVNNPAPSAANDAVTVAEDGSATIPVLANDSDPDGDALSVIAASAPNGTVTINADGTLTYRPAADFNGADTISYTISDGQGGLSTATVAVTVTPVNDAPVAAPLAGRADNEGESVSFNAGASFSDADDAVLTFTATGLPAGLSIDPATGIISGTIDRSASQLNSGSYTVTVTATDASGATASSSFVWTFTNPSPIANDDVFTTTEEGPITVAVLANDSDPDGDPIVIIAATASRGSVTINADGTLTYTPGPDFNGTDVISYTISDGQNGSATATGTATIIAINDAPETVGTLPQRNDAEGEAVSLPVAGAFRDVDDTVLTFAATGLPPGLAIDPVTGLISGTIARDAAAAQGSIYAVTITITDPSGATAAQQFTWVITNPAPTAAADAVTTTEDVAVVVPVLANDSDPDGDPLTVTAASALNGTVQIRADGSLLYTPAADFNGTDTISYTIDDGQGGVSSATVTVNVTAANDTPVTTGLAPRTSAEGQAVSVDVTSAFSDVDRDALSFAATGLPPGLGIDPATGIISGTIAPSASLVPDGQYAVTVIATDPSGAAVSTAFTWTVTNPAPTAAADSAVTSEDTPVIITVLANDADPDGDVLTVIAASAGDGVVTINPDGTITYTPNADFNGTDVISYTISDGQGGASTALVTVTVTAVNDTPASVSLPDLYDSNSEAVTVPAGTAFSDVDGDPLTFTATGLPAGLGIDPATGTISGTIDPGASAVNGGVYAVTVRGTDPSGSFAERVFAWTISNLPPLAQDDAVTTTEDISVTIPVLSNDIDPDGNPATPVQVSIDSVVNGTATVDGNGAIIFTPAANFTGMATISYRIDDGLGGFSTASVTIDVTPANDTPIADGIGAQTGRDGEAVTLPTAGAFADPDGDALTFSATGLPPGLNIDPASGIISGTLSPGASAATYNVVVTATDPSGAAVSAAFTWTVQNPAPTAVDDSITTVEDMAVTIPVLANDSDPDGDALTVTAAAAGRGSVTIGAGGVLTYTPPADFVGTDTISYTITDAQGASSTATVTVTVTPGNDAPVASPLADRAAGDGTPISLATAGAFSDSDGDPLTFAATGLPAGLAIDSATGIISGTIAPGASQNANGIYTVTVTATDPSGAAASSSFTWTIDNVAPVAVDDTADVAEGGTLVLNVLANDVDGDGDALTVVSAQANNGSVVINPDGSLSYTPAATFSGTDVISYTISDGQGGFSTATATITVAGVNDAPTSVGLPSRIDPTGRAVSLNLAPAFDDIDGNALRFTATGLPPGLAIDPATGIVSGTIAPGAAVSGANVYTVSVTADDGNGGTVTTSFSWTVTNVAPTAVNDDVTVAEDGSVVIPVLANDINPDGDPLTIIQAAAGRGTVVINADGTLTYTPPADFTGSDTISYTISDGQGGTSTGTVAVTVTGANDAPTASPLPSRSDTDGELVDLNIVPAFDDPDGDALTFAATGLPPGLAIDPATGRITGRIAADASATNGGVYVVVVTATDPAGASVSTSFTWTALDGSIIAAPDAATVPEDGSVSIPVLANDSSGDGDPISLVSARAGNGTVTVNPDGTLTYVPAANFVGEDTIVYTIGDGQGGFASAVVTVTVTPANDAPTTLILPDRRDADGEAVNVALASGFDDIDGDKLTFTATGLPPGLTIDPGTGFVTGRLAADASTLNGGVYTVAVTGTDPSGASASTSFTWTITNPVPVIAGETVTVSEDGMVTISVLANDFDPDGDALSILSATAPNGTVTVNADGTLTYAPFANFNGEDAITYIVSDGRGGTNTATVIVTVTSVNDAPVAANDAATASGNAPLVIPVLANDSDVDDDRLTVISANATRGIVTINPDGTITYRANVNAAGTDTITYTISDGSGGTSTATVAVTIVEVPNRAPVDAGETVDTPANEAVTVDVLANASDADGDPLRVIAASADTGTVQVNADGTITYTPALGFVGVATVTYVVSDGRGGVANSSFTVNVLGQGVDVSQLLEIGRANFAPASTFQILPSTDPQFMALDPILLNAINDIRPLGGMPDLLPEIEAEGPISIAINGLSPLNGLEPLDIDGSPVGQEVDRLERRTDLRFGVDRLFDRRFGDFGVEGFTGFSVRFADGGEIMVESVVRDRTIYVEVRESATAEEGEFVEHRLRMADGRAVPDWIRFDARGLAIIETPPDVETLRIIIRSVRADGSYVDTAVVVQTATGEIQLDTQGEGRTTAALLGDTAAQGAAMAEREAALLAAAFG